MTKRNLLGKGLFGLDPESQSIEGSGETRMGWKSEGKS